MRKIIILLILILNAASMAHALGVTANTTITAKTVSLNASYTNTGGISNTVTISGSDLTQTVTAIYGFSNPLSGGSDQTIRRNSTAGYLFSFLNRGNVSNTLNSTEALNLTGRFGTSWTHSLTPAAGAMLVNINATRLVTLNITSSITAYDGSTGISLVTFNINTGLVSGNYTGFNNRSYGDNGLYAFTKTTSITGPDVVFVDKSITRLQSPTSGGYQGLSSDAVPGAIIEYKINIKNNGTTSSALTRVEEMIPTDSVFLTVSSNSYVIETGTGVGNAGDVDYFHGGTYNNAFTNTYSGRLAIQKIRFNIGPMNAGVSRNVIFRVTIKD